MRSRTSVPMSENPRRSAAAVAVSSSRSSAYRRVAAARFSREIAASVASVLRRRCSGWGLPRAASAAALLSPPDLAQRIADIAPFTDRRVGRPADGQRGRPALPGGGALQRLPPFEAERRPVVHLVPAVGTQVCQHRPEPLPAEVAHHHRPVLDHDADRGVMNGSVR